MNFGVNSEISLGGISVSLTPWEKNVLPLNLWHFSFHFLRNKPKISISTMADNDDLLDYEDEEQTDQVVAEAGDQKKDVKGTYVSIHSSGFRDFLLKPEILRAIVDCGFEHPSAGEFEWWTFFYGCLKWWNLMIGTSESILWRFIYLIWHNL